jgi:putative endonuclease
MNETTHAKGKGAEDRALAHLRLKGYRLLERNFRAGRGEIDLIVQRGRILVFVEVKARRGKGKGSPLEAVPPAKVRRLSAAAASYLGRHPLEGRTCRFDLVGVGPERNLLGFPKIRHVENAFAAEGNYNV